MYIQRRGVPIIVIIIMIITALIAVE